MVKGRFSAIFTCVVFPRNSVFLLSFVVLLSIVAPGQNSAPAFALVEGAVTNKISGAPVRHAHVLYVRVASASGEPSSPISIDTDSDGRFNLQLEPGPYRLWVEHSGYAPAYYGARTSEGQGTVLALAAGERVQGANLQLVPYGAIAGRVLDEDGEPLLGVAVQVLRFSYVTGRRQLVPAGGASSNDRGEYRVFGLPAGRYFLLATPRGAPLSHPIEKGALAPELTDPFAALYYPGVLDFPSATPVRLAEGGEVGDLDFHLQRVRALTVRGRILSPVEDFAGSQIQCVLAHNEGGAASWIDRSTATLDKATGRFEFHGVAPGSYLLVASQLYRGRALGGRVAVEVSNAPQDNVTVPVAPAFDVGGTVEVEGGAPGHLSGITVRLTPAEGLAAGPLPASKPATDGRIHLAGVTPGVWNLDLEGLPEGMSIKSATYGGLDLLSGSVNIAGNSAAVMRVVLGANSAQISGVVNDNGQPRRAMVVLVPTAPELKQATLLYRWMSTQDGGAFSFKGVRPGAYKLFAFEEIEPFAWLDPEFMKSVEANGEAVSVGEGEQVVRNISPVVPEK